MDPKEARELEALLEAWPKDQEGLKRCLLELKAAALKVPGASLGFVSRPGVSHSLRFDLEPRPAGRARPVFFLTDVVDLGGELMLSVCFYEDEISDPAQLGNAIPRGLFDETGYCFDAEEYDPAQMAYLTARLAEAASAARP